MIISLLPAIILNQGLETTIISPKGVLVHIKKEFSTDLSAGTVYPVFKALEVDGYIERIPNKTNRIYRLTSEGNQIIEYCTFNQPLLKSILCQAKNRRLEIFLFLRNPQTYCSR
jgi:predicted transcriptional regulator